MDLDGAPDVRATDGPWPANPSWGILVDIAGDGWPSRCSSSHHGLFRIRGFPSSARCGVASSSEHHRVPIYCRCTWGDGPDAGCSATSRGLTPGAPAAPRDAPHAPRPILLASTLGGPRCRGGRRVFAVSTTTRASCAGARPAGRTSAPGLDTRRQRTPSRLEARGCPGFRRRAGGLRSRSRHVRGPGRSRWRWRSGAPPARRSQLRRSCISLAIPRTSRAGVTGQTLAGTSSRWTSPRTCASIRSVPSTGLEP